MEFRSGQESVAAYFRAYNSGDEAAHTRLFHPEATFFGSGSGPARGLVAIRGVYHAARGRLGYMQFIPKEVFGAFPEIGVRVEVQRAERSFQGLWVFRLGEDGLIRHLCVLYNLRDAFGG